MSLINILLEQTPLQLDRQGIKGREDGKRGGWGDDYFGYFRLKGAIIRERGIIKGWLLLSEGAGAQL